METLRVEAERHRMLASRNHNSTQDIVGPEDVCGFPVNRTLPPWIVDIREDSNTLCIRLRFKSQGIRFVSRKVKTLTLMGNSGREASACTDEGSWQLLTETTVDDSCGAGIDGSESGQFLIGIVGKQDIIYKPSITHCPRILHGNRLATLQGQDGILRVQHVQHGEEGVAPNAVEQAACRADSLE